MSYSVFENKSDCCGCSACASSCPKNAITMTADDEGFLYPHINAKLCVNCDLCKKVCDFQKSHTKTEEAVSVFAAKATDDVRKESTSGGLYKVLSDLVLDLGGTVYGAAFDDDMKVLHTRAKTHSERDAQRGSKYVQSDVSDAFSLVRQDLASGKYVLFSGTACQIAGLISFLSGVDKKRLLTVDVLCHGTPSPLVFSEYIKFVEKKRGKKVKNYLSRAKDEGYTFNERIEYNDGLREVKTMLAEAWNNVFYSDNALRPSCYGCKYVKRPRPSDITIADFWGIENIDPDFYDKKGVSLVILNTEKGNEFFGKVKGLLTLSEQTFEKAVIKNHNLETPTARPACRDKFWEDVKNRGFEFIFKKYGGYNPVRALKRLIKKIIKR